jgi:secreted trypsin-like serine protease
VRRPSNRQLRRLAVLAAVLACSVAFTQEQILPGERISGGEPTTIAKHRWQVALYISTQGKTYFCSGSIIAARWVLTAAHCFKGDVDSSHTRIKTGVDNFMTDGVWGTPKLIIPHPQFNPQTYENDVALVMLDQDHTAEMIALADGNTLSAGSQKLEVSGWGALTFGGPLSDELQQAKVSYVSNADCAKVYPHDAVFSSTLCAGERAGGVDACQGDSGGPLIVRRETPVLVGVVSHGDGCAQKLKYGLYARVAAFRPWITCEITKSRQTLSVRT